jgi:hypothetical protein
MCRLAQRAVISFQSCSHLICSSSSSSLLADGLGFARSAAVARSFTWHYLHQRAKGLNQLLVSLASTTQGKTQMLHILAEILLETFSSANVRVPL